MMHLRIMLYTCWSLWSDPVFVNRTWSDQIIVHHTSSDPGA